MKENIDITLILDNGKHIIEYELIKYEETLKKIEQEEERKFQERVKLIEYLEDTNTMNEVLNRIYGVERITSKIKKDNQIQEHTTPATYALVTVLNYYVGEHLICCLEPHLFYKEGDDTYKKYHHLAIGKPIFSSVSKDYFNYLLLQVFSEREFLRAKDWIEYIAKKTIVKRILQEINSKERSSSPFVKKLIPSNK